MPPKCVCVALVAVFGFGLIVVLASCIRIYWCYYVLEQTYDVTWYGFHLWIWSAVEIQLGIICACVPWLKSTFKLWRTGQTVAGASWHTAPSGGQGVPPTIGSKKATAARINSLEMAWIGEGPGGGKYLDLEHGSADGDSHIEPSKPAHWA